MKTVVWRPGYTHVIPTTSQRGVPIDAQPQAGTEQRGIPETLIVAEAGDVFAEIAAYDGDCEVVFDDSIAPCVIPGGQIWPGYGIDPTTGQAKTSGVPLLSLRGRRSNTTVIVLDGARLLGIASATDLTLSCEAVTVVPLAMGPIARLQDAKVLNRTGALVPCVQTPDLGGLGIFTENSAFDNSAVPGHPILQMGTTSGAGTALTMLSEFLLTITPDAITQKTAAGTVQFKHDGSIAVGYLIGQCAALVGVTDINVDSSGDVPASRLINTTAPLTGGGDLTADRTLAISPATGIAAGSMSGADKAKLDTVQTGTSAAMVAGTVTIATANITASSVIQVTRNTPGGTLGNLSVPSATVTPGAPGTFVINSDSALETSTVNWLVVL